MHFISFMAVLQTFPCLWKPQEDSAGNCIPACYCLQGDFSGSSEEGGIKHCLQLEDAAVLNPVAYLNGLAKAITDKGGKIYEQTRVRKPDRSVIETEAGNKVSLSMQEAHWRINLLIAVNRKDV